MSRSRHQRQILTGAAAVLLAAGLPTGMAQAATTASKQATCSLPFPFSSGQFHDSLQIDNRYLPMVPGTRLTYDGTTVDDKGRTVPHTVVFTITDMLKVVDGVPSRVVHDVDSSRGQVTEAELSFWAQDDRGTVWNTGEYPEEYDKGAFTGAPSVWIGGLAGAMPGIHMLPHPTDRSQWEKEYSQGVAPKIDFLDCAEIERAGGSVTVPAGRFTDTVLTYERSPLASLTDIQTKEYAPGVGIVRIGAIPVSGEQLTLSSLTHLGPSELDRLDAQVVTLDRHGHQVSQVYKNTPPVRRD
jgi:hypothetical protein